MNQKLPEGQQVNKGYGINGALFPYIMISQIPVLAEVYSAQTTVSGSHDMSIPLVTCSLCQEIWSAEWRTSSGVATPSTTRCTSS